MKPQITPRINEPSWTGGDHQQIHWPQIGITPHNQISTKHQKCRSRTPRGCRTIINKWEGGTIYQNMRDSWLFIISPFRTICKQPGPTIITTSMILWLLLDQDTPHYFRNAKQMTYKTDIYQKSGHGRILPPDPRKCYNRVNLHSNIRQASLSLPVVTFLHHTRTSRIYDCQKSGNRPRKQSTQGQILLHRESNLATQILTLKWG